MRKREPHVRRPDEPYRMTLEEAFLSAAMLVIIFFLAFVLLPVVTS